MTVNKSNIEFYIEREFSDFLERMTDDEINKVTDWCNALIKKRQKLENDIITNVNITLSEAEDKVNELYHNDYINRLIGRIDEDYIIDEIFDYTIEKAVSWLYPDFPIFENLDSFERENLIDYLLDSLEEFEMYWD